MTLKLKNITLANLDQVTVEPSASNVDRGYGRRFTVTMGNESKEVVFKELYKNAQRLLKDAKHRIKDLNEVSAFIAKLEDVENRAIVTYKGRGGWYKFRTFFHRFFGGAYRGSHLERLHKLQNKLTPLAQDDFTNFLSQHTRCLKALSSQGIEVDVNDKKFHVEWRENTLSIWDKTKPEDVTFFVLSIDGVDCNNIEAIATSCVPVFAAIEDKVQEQEVLDARRRSESNMRTAGFRDEFMQKFKSFNDLYPGNNILQAPIIIDGKNYSARSVASGLQIQEIGKSEGVLSIREGYSSFDGLADGIPDEFLPVIEEIQKRIETIQARIKRQLEEEITTLANLEGLSNDHEGFIKSAALLISQSLNSTFTIGDKKFDTWSIGDRLYIQEKSKKGSNHGLLQIERVNNGRSASYSIKFEGVIKDSIPDEVKHIFNAAVLEAYKTSSIYSGTNIQLRREGLDLIPEWHLNQFCSLGARSFRVAYTGERGRDAGGLKREYVGKLASTISSRKSLFAEADGALKIPRIVRDQEDSVLYCDLKEQEIYQNVGKLFSRCYNSRQTNGYYEDDLITTGRLFSDVVFKVAFPLSASDLNRPFAQQRDAQIRMAKIILAHLDSQGADTVKNVIKCFDLLEGNNLDACLSNPDRSDELQFPFYLLEDSVREAYEDENFGPDIDKIRANKDQFKEELFNKLMKDLPQVDELNGIALGSMLDPIYHIAVGMETELPNWNTLRAGSVARFSSKAQGSIDRDKIVSSIEYQGNNRDMNQKITWLKEWIREASDAEIQSFMKFVTGAASLAGTTKIKIDSQAQGKPFLSTSTCNMTIHMSDQMTYPTVGPGRWGADQWDNTKEAFIRNLKGSMSVEDFGNA